MIDLESMELTCREFVAFQHSKKEGKREARLRANYIGRFHQVLRDIADIADDTVRIAAISDDKVESPNSNDSYRVQHAARKLRQMANIFTEAANRIQRTRHQQRETMTIEQAHLRWIALRECEYSDVQEEVESLEKFIALEQPTSIKDIECKLGVAAEYLDEDQALHLNSIILHLPQFTKAA